MTDVVRDERGRFPAGTSGNPRGRPPSKKNRITELKQDLELAIRRNINAQDVQDIVNAMIQEAKGGSIGAARLILDKVLPNAKEADEVDEGGKQFVFRVENATIAVTAANNPPNEQPIEGEFHTVEDTDEQAEPQTGYVGREHRGQSPDPSSHPQGA
jgi:hypothetical protein